MSEPTAVPIHVDGKSERGSGGFAEIEMQNRQRAERQASYILIARDQGLVIVRTGPKSGMVVKIACGSHVEFDYFTQCYFTYLDSSVVFKGRIQKCKEYIAKHGNPIPKKLHP